MSCRAMILVMVDQVTTQDARESVVSQVRAALYYHSGPKDLAK